MKIGIIGCAGRMGQVLINEVLSNPNTTLSGGIEREGSQFIGKDLGELVMREKNGLTVHSDLDKLFQDSDAVIDFTAPEASVEAAKLSAKHHKIHVIGTTGLTEIQYASLSESAKDAVIVWSSNMSIGVTILNTLVEQVAGWLDDSYDIEVLEMHHRHKKDSPSGTAITLGEYAAKGRGVELKDVACYAREGIVGERPKGEIGFATLRGGGVIGDHTVMFASEDDRIEITHKSSSRNIYAKGAVRACLWAKGQNPGIYSIKDVLKG